MCHRIGTFAGKTSEPMIQRIQSVFLLLVTVAMVAVLFLPIWGKVDLTTREVVNLNAFQIVHTQENSDGVEAVVFSKPTFWISVLALLVAGVALFSIFQYTNRLRQIQLGALNALLMAGLIMVSFWYSTKGNDLLNPQLGGQYFMGFYVMLAGLFFNMLANRFIRRDEKLVRSADRIR